MPEEFVPLSALARHVEYENEVAALARRFYEEEGCPEGRAAEHWVRAEAEVHRRHASEALVAESAS